MKLILCRSHAPGSILLRLILWSPWSHSAIYDPETGFVWDSTLFQGGVRKHRMHDFACHYSRLELRDSGITDIDAARGWLDEQVGKGYDWTALLSWVVRRDWSRDDKWFCSELTEAARNCFGKPRFRAESSRITPAHQDMTL